MKNAGREEQMLCLPLCSTHLRNSKLRKITQPLALNARKDCTLKPRPSRLALPCFAFAASYHQDKARRSLTSMRSHERARGGDTWSPHPPFHLSPLDRLKRQHTSSHHLSRLSLACFPSHPQHRARRVTFGLYTKLVGKRVLLLRCSTSGAAVPRGTRFQVPAQAAVCNSTIQLSASAAVLIYLSRYSFAVAVRFHCTVTPR